VFKKPSTAARTKNEDVQEGTRDCSKRKDDTTRMQSTDYTIRKEKRRFKEWTGLYPKDNEWVDRVMQLACSASLEAKAKRRRKAFVGGDKTEYRACRGGNAKLSRFGFTSVAHPAGLAIGAHHS
jgi:hypothetical protein